MVLGFLSNGPFLVANSSRARPPASCQICQRAVPCMKAKGRKGQSPAKRSSKAVVGTSGTGKGRSRDGFATRQGDTDRASGNITEDGVADDEATHLQDEDVVKEDGSGSAGDATPHRAFTRSRAVLEDPMATPDIQTTVTTASPAPTVDPSRLVVNPSERWKWDISLDEMVERLALASIDDKLETVVVSNRDHVSERMMYRFTSAILQAESQRVLEEAANMRRLRADVIRICWEYDRPRREILYQAEERLVNVLKNDELGVNKAVDRSCGKSTVEVDSFWIVTFAALAAWEVQNPGAGPEAYSEVQIRLKEVAQALGESRRVLGLLSPSLALVGHVLTAPDLKRQAETMSEITEDIIIEMGVIIEQIRFWPQNAYGAFIQKFQDIREYAIQNILKYPVPKMVPFRFTPQEIERGSRLIEFKVRNAAR